MTQTFNWDTGGGEGGTPPIGREIIAGNGLTGGGDLSEDVTLDVGAGDGITVGLDSVAVKLATTSGLSLSGGDLQLDDSIAGSGLAIGSKILSVNVGNGIEISSDAVAVSLATTSGLQFSSGKLQINDTIAGVGLTISNKILAVSVGDGLEIDVDNVEVDLSATSGLEFSGGDLQIADTVAGNGLTITNKILAVGAGTLISIGADAVNLSNGDGQYQVPLTGATPFTPAWTSTSDEPGQAIRVLRTDANGVLKLVELHADTIDNTTASTNLTIKSTGDIVFKPSGNDILPDTSWTLNIGSINKKYLTLWASELWVETLVAQSVMATIGGRIVIAPTTTLVQDLAAAATTMYVKHNQMANGDRVYLESSGKVEWIALTSDPVAYGPYYYHTCTRNLDGSGANDWYQGDAVLNTGTTGDGYIDIYSISSIRSGSHYGPSIVGNIRTGTTYNQLVEGWAIGNLNGLYGYSTDIYGAAFGKYAGSNSFITVDPTNGFRIIYKSTAEQVLGKWDASGNITIGEVGASKDNIYMSSGAIAIRNNTTDRIAMTSAGVLTIKDSGGAAVFTFDSSAGAEMTKPLTLGTGGGIYQGTGTFASPTTGLKIYNSSGVGMIAGYNGGTVQWYGNTDGKLYAGAGYVWLDAAGVTLKRSTLYSYGLRWANSSGVARGWIDSNDSGFYFDNRSDDGTRLSTISLENASGGTRYFSVQVGSGAYWEFDNEGGGSGGRGEVHFTYSDLGIDGGVHIGADYGDSYDNDLVVDGGIAVGISGTDPVTGAILLKEITAPGTPASTQGILYAGTDSLLHFKNDAGTIYEMPIHTQNTDYSGTSTIVGWSSWTTKFLSYARIGNLVFVHFYMVGTSNSTSTTFTVPFTNGEAQNLNFAMRCQDNSGTIQAGTGSLAASSATVTLYKDYAGSTWTASGTKAIYGFFVYWA